MKPRPNTAKYVNITKEEERKMQLTMKEERVITFPFSLWKKVTVIFLRLPKLFPKFTYNCPCGLPSSAKYYTTQAIQNILPLSTTRTYPRGPLPGASVCSPDPI